MISRWNEASAAYYVASFGSFRGSDFALSMYLNSLLEEEKTGCYSGSCVSVKVSHTDLVGETSSVLYLKTPGEAPARAKPEHWQPFDLRYLEKLGHRQDLSEEALAADFRLGFRSIGATNPPQELMAHALIGKKHVIRVHAGAIQVLAGQSDSRRHMQNACGGRIGWVPSSVRGWELARQSAAALQASSEIVAIVWGGRGIFTWGETAQETYVSLIDLVTEVENYIERNLTTAAVPSSLTSAETATGKYNRLAPILRGALAQPTGNLDHPYARVVLQPLINDSSLALADSGCGVESAGIPLPTSDFLRHTGAYPLWIVDPLHDDPDEVRRQISTSIERYSANLTAELSQRASEEGTALPSLSVTPRIIFIPGVGAVCAGRNIHIASLLKNIVSQEINAMLKGAALGAWENPSKQEILQQIVNNPDQFKPERIPAHPLERQVALVTGAAGAIGMAVCEELLENGCNVAVTDLPGENLVHLAGKLRQHFGPQVAAIPLDVTDPASVTHGFEQAAGTWGGVDLLVINAGLAHVSSLEEMNLDVFHKLTRVNVEGTLLLLREAARHFRIQCTGGDIILLSTKNVFAPGARFGAYSATKAASHQLARIASLELAELGVRVNMVAPDAVFSHGGIKSGLWAEVGPDRMRARGLSEEGLEEYYRTRNLLKAKVTGKHVAKAVLFFATRQTPTTGATLPVDGGLPDAAPR